MGSIVSIYQDPKTWDIKGTNKHLKQEYGGEKLFRVVYGEWDDELSGIQPMEIHMRKSVLEKVLTGEYTVHSNSQYKRTLILQDKNGNIVPRIMENSYAY